MMVKFTVTVCAEPVDGVIDTVAEYVPAVMPLTFTVKVRGEEAPDASLPLPGETVSQVADGAPTVQVRPSPPVLETLTFCVAGFVPAVVVNVRVVVSICMAGGGIEMEILIADGLPLTALFVKGSVALIDKLTVAVVPPATPVAFTMTVTVVEAPAASVPVVAEEIVTYAGAPDSAAVQVSGSPPVLRIVTVCELLPVAWLKVSVVGVTDRAGGASRFRLTPTVCGLPTMVMPPLSTAASEIVPA